METSSAGARGERLDTRRAFDRSALSYGMQRIPTKFVLTKSIDEFCRRANHFFFLFIIENSLCSQSDLFASDGARVQMTLPEQQSSVSYHRHRS